MFLFEHLKKNEDCFKNQSKVSECTINMMVSAMFPCRLYDVSTVPFPWLPSSLSKR